MNHSIAIFLISDKARAITVSYDKIVEGQTPSTTMFKTLDQKIKPKDYVVVDTDTRHGMTVCQVVEVDVEPDFDSSVPVKWIIGVVDKADADEIKRQEDDAIARIKSAEKRKKREELRDALLADAGDAVKALPIYSAGKKASK